MKRRVAFGVTSWHAVAPLGLILALALLFTGCARAPEEVFPEPVQLPSVQARVSEENPRVGDIVEVDIRLTAEERLSPVPWREHLHEDIFVVDAPEEREFTENGRWMRDTRLRVALYSVTRATLFAEPSLILPTEEEPEIALPWISLEVVPLVEDGDALPNPGNTELMDFRGSEAIRRFYRNVGVSLIGFALLVALVLIVWAKTRTRRAPPPPLPQWDKIALQKMRDLRDSEIWTSLDTDASAVALSKILREFIERRHLIHAPELTTEEFLVEASERQPWPEEDQRELEAFFVAVDKIKFAGERPGADVLEELMRAAERFVRASGQAMNGGET